MSFGLGVTCSLALYLLSTLAVGLYARRSRQSEGLGDFYLAGRRLSGVVLLLTLYATQYSGNTLVAYPGEAYRLGFSWIMSVGFMLAIIVVYLWIAPRLHRLSRRHHFITPGDWIDHRFRSPTLSLVANSLFVISIANYLLTQLMAMGHVVAGLSDQRIPYWMGVILLAVVIIVYETLGGLRAVAWTDCIQGLFLFAGLAGLMVAILPTPDHLRAATEWVLTHQPEKAAVPSGVVAVTWASTLLLIGLSGAVYPQAIQRIYAAKSAGSLKRSLGWMAFMPFVTTFTVFLVGILGIQRFGGLENIQADQIMPILLREWAGQSLWLYAMAMLVVVGVFAAIMSTADSVLLSLSSILAKDFVGKHVMPEAAEERLTHIGKAISWILMAVLVSIALVPRISLWGLTELKMEILVQVSPLFLLGLAWSRLRASAAVAGMIAGSALAAGLTLAGYGKLYGLHAGLIGWALNVTLAGSLSLLPQTKDEGLPRKTRGSPEPERSAGT